MTQGLGSGTGPKRRVRLLAQLDKMVATGRVTQQEAAGLRAAAGPGEFDDMVQGIRVRHATARLGAAVEEGSMSQADADGLLVRLKNGEHPTALRAQVGKLRRGAGGRGTGPRPEPPGD